MKITETNSQTPPPTDSSVTVDLKKVIELFDKYYKHEDRLNEPHFQFGKMIEKELTFNHIDILKTVVYMLVDDIKSNHTDNTALVDQLTRALTSIIDSLPATSRNIDHNKRIVSKLTGFFLTLHELHI